MIMKKSLIDGIKRWSINMGKMRNPKIENKYNLKVADIKRMEVADESKLCEPLFWRNDVINAWCISRSIGTDADKKYCNDNEIWLGIYDKPYYGRRVHFYASCWGGMGSYRFKEFFNIKEIESEKDLETQEETLKILNILLDEGIVKFKEK